MKTITHVVNYLGELWGATGWILVLAGVWVALSHVSSV